MVFDTAVTEILDNLQAYLEQAEQAQESLEASQTQLSEMSEQVEADSDTLSERAESLLESTTESRTELMEEAEAVREALTQLQERVQTLQGEVEQEVQETQEAIATLDSEVESLTSELESNLQEVDTSLSSLRDRTEAVDATLQETLSQTTNYLLNEVTNELQTHQADIQQRTADLHGYVTEQCIPEMTTQVTDFASHLQVVVEKLTQRVTTLGDSTEQSAQESLDFVGQIQEEYFGNFLNTAKELEQLMDRLSNLIDTTSSDVVSAKDALVDGVSATNMGLNTALGLLEEVREFLGRF